MKYVDLCRASGLLNTVIVLNYDLMSAVRFYNLNISVNDTRYVDFVTVNVELVDINDNSPVFANDSYRYVSKLFLSCCMAIYNF